METAGQHTGQERSGGDVSQGRQAAAVLATVALVVHFALILAHAGPTNPVQSRFAAFADSYATPFFVQDWQLFAPDPIVTEEELFVRWRGQDGSASDYVAITEAYVMGRRHNLLPNKTIYAINGPLTLYKNDLAAVVDLLEDECGNEFTDEDFFVTESALECLYDVDAYGAQQLAYSRYDLLYVALWHIPVADQPQAQEFQVRFERRMPAPLGAEEDKGAAAFDAATESAWLKVSDYRGD